MPNRNDVRTLRLTAPLRSGETVSIPVWTVDSNRPGPMLLLLAAQHGNEVQGGEAIRQFVGLVSRRRMLGKVFAVPFANLPAIRQRRPHINMKPEQPYANGHGHNMDLTWPGRANGNDSARLSHAIYQAFGRQATHCLDLHCWSKYMAPCLVVPDTPGSRELAERVGHRFVFVHRGLLPANISGHFNTTGRVGMVYEFSGQYGVDDWEVQCGLRVIINFSKAIGLLAGRPLKATGPVLFSDRVRSTVVRAPRSGLFVPERLRAGDRVNKGMVLGHILNDRDLYCVSIRSPAAGYLRTYGAGRPNSDVAISGYHAYVEQDEMIATIWQPTR